MTKRKKSFGRTVSASVRLVDVTLSCVLFILSSNLIYQHCHKNHKVGGRSLTLRVTFWVLALSSDKWKFWLSSWMQKLLKFWPFTQHLHILAIPHTCDKCDGWHISWHTYRLHAETAQSNTNVQQIHHEFQHFVKVFWVTELMSCCYMRKKPNVMLQIESIQLLHLQYLLEKVFKCLILVILKKWHFWQSSISVCCWNVLQHTTGHKPNSYCERWLLHQ